MSEHQPQKQPEPILPRPGETRKTEDEHGPIFQAICGNCGHQVTSRVPGEARCVCGRAVELKS